MFGFDERYAMFDITPVENQFILEYLPEAKGDYVKVYLYGLMRCYHPEDDMSLARMCHELNMTEEDVTAAFRYWERRRLVRRISDNPPQWQYINIKQLNLTTEDNYDPEYEEFSKDIYDAFDGVRRLHGNDLITCFDWHENLKLPTEVIIMLLKHIAKQKGKNFRIHDAERIATQMATENILTVDAAEDFLSRDELAYKGMKKILKKLGKSYMPSEAQVNLYRKWNREWGFSPEAIEEAADMTAKGEPSLSYLEKILDNLRLENKDASVITKENIHISQKKADEFKEVLNKLGNGTIINSENKKIYDKMKALYPQSIILTGARECCLLGKDLDSLLELLQSWKEKGLESSKDVEEYVKIYHDQKALIRELRKIWGIKENRVGEIDCRMITKWEKEYGFDREMILVAAPYAAEANQPMAYLDKILADYRNKGIMTPEQVKKTHEGRKGDNTLRTRKMLPAQNYEQRDYKDVQEQLMEAQRKRVLERLRADGGESDA